MKPYKCTVCGKITTGRIPKNGDGSAVYPRRHYYQGKLCEGIYEFAVYVPKEEKK